MELEKQVCSLELAKKLRELGVKQESVFWHWATDVEGDGLTWWTVSEKEPRRGKKVRELSTPQHYRGKIAAFTVAELGEMLPAIVEYKGTRRFPVSRSKEDATGAREYKCFLDGTSLMDCFFIADTEADARAKMLIYLLENRLIPGESLDGEREAVPRSVRHRGVRAVRLPPNA